MTCAMTCAESICFHQIQLLIEHVLLTRRLHSDAQSQGTVQHVYAPRNNTVSKALFVPRRVGVEDSLPRGQDPNNVPYDPASSIPAQVAQSFAASRANLRTDYVDSLVLHSPFANHEVRDLGA